MQPVLRIARASTLVAVVHSALASRPPKRAAARAFGQAAVDAWYRPFFVVQAVGATARWACAVLREPDRTLWRAPAALAAVMVAGQIASTWWMWRAARAVGIGRLVGVPGVRAPRRPHAAARAGSPGPGARAAGHARDGAVPALAPSAQCPADPDPVAATAHDAQPLRGDPARHRLLRARLASRGGPPVRRARAGLRALPPLWGGVPVPTAATVARLHGGSSCLSMTSPLP